MNYLKITLLLFFILLPISRSNAVSIIRDGEIEELLWELVRPIIEEAGLEEKAIKI